MRKSILATILSVGLIGASVSFATTAAREQQVKLYAAANTQKLIKKLPADAPLVPIIRKGEWIKVGDSRNGDVGWINKQQYQTARADFYRPDVQTFFVNVDTTAQGKPKIDIVAFKNGKKLTDQQARAMYEKLRKQQAQEYRSMRQFNRSMDKIMQQNFISARRLFDSAWMDAPFTVMEPIEVYPQLPPLSGNAKHHDF